MSEPTEPIGRDLERLREARGRGPLATLRAWVSLSGPGWLQSAITLGGGSLAASLYLGVLSGTSLLWLQPLAMVLGIVMLSAIAYVTLSTGERPFRAVVDHVNPALGWGWALATLMANVVWSLPQFSLASGVVQQNLAPGLLGPEGPLGDTGGKLVISVLVLTMTVAVTWSYGSGRRGVVLYERMLKVLVAAIVLCFMGVVVRLATAGEGIGFGEILRGFVPDLGALNRPSEGYAAVLAQLPEGARAFWSNELVSMQRDVMIAAAATAVGINMTFLLPHTLLSRKWNKEFRGFASFDLALGMLVPFLLATSCVVIAAASRFHTEPVPGLVLEDATIEDTADGASPAPAAKLVRDYEGRLKKRAAVEMGAEAWASLEPEAQGAHLLTMPLAERRLAAMLVKRDAFDLAQSLKPLTGDLFANLVFGLGVLGMALSTITLLMLISGFVICEMLGVPPEGKAHRLGSLAACSGALGPFFWGSVAVYLAVPTSVFGMVLLPIAYWTFFLMMNSEALLGEHRPRGRSRLAWNSLMLPAAAIATFASLTSAWTKTGWKGVGALGVFLLLVILTHRRNR